MAEKKINKFKEKDSTLLYYQQNIDGTTHFLVGFKIPSADMPNEHEHIFRYKNVIAYVDDETGSIRIPLVKPGMLHLMEHSLFHSCKEFNIDDVYKFFRKTNTICNAYTSQNVMVVDINCPTKYLEDNLNIVSKMLFRTDYKTGTIEEKGTIKHELHYIQDRDTVSPILDLILNASVQLGSDIVGIADEIIDSITPNEMSRFARTHFTSQNLVMSVVSDLPYDEIERLSNKYFVEKAVSIPDSEVTPNIPVCSLEQDYLVPCLVPDSKTVTLYFYFEPTSDYEESEKMAYLEDYIFNGFNGILVEKFRKEKQLTYTPQFYTQPITSNYSLNCFKIQTDVQNINTCLEVFTKTIRELAINGISDEQMEGFKEYWSSHRLRKNNLKSRDPDTMLNDYLYGKEVFISNMYEKVASITKEEFNDYFKRNYINTHIIFQPVGAIENIKFPSIGTIISYIRPYENYAYENIYDQKGIDDVMQYLENLQKDALAGKDVVSEMTLVKPSDYSEYLKELKEKEQIENNEEIDDEENNVKTSNNEIVNDNNETKSPAVLNIVDGILNNKQKNKDDIDEEITMHR